MLNFDVIKRHARVRHFAVITQYTPTNDIIRMDLRCRGALDKMNRFILPKAPVTEEAGTFELF